MIVPRLGVLNYILFTYNANFESLKTGPKPMAMTQVCVYCVDLASSSLYLYSTVSGAPSITWLYIQWLLLIGSFIPIALAQHSIYLWQIYKSAIKLYNVEFKLRRFEDIHLILSDECGHFCTIRNRSVTK